MGVVIITLWYAVRNHQHKEDALFQCLTVSNIGTFYQRILYHPVNPDALKILPYITGYLVRSGGLDHAHEQPGSKITTIGVVVRTKQRREGTVGIAVKILHYRFV